MSLLIINLVLPKLVVQSYIMHILYTIAFNRDSKKVTINWSFIYLLVLFNHHIQKKSNAWSLVLCKLWLNIKLWIYFIGYNSLNIIHCPCWQILAVLVPARIFSSEQSWSPSMLKKWCHEPDKRVLQMKLEVLIVSCLFIRSTCLDIPKPTALSVLFVNFVYTWMIQVLSRQRKLVGLPNPTDYPHSLNFYLFFQCYYYWFSNII